MEESKQALNEPINPDGEYRIYQSSRGEEPIAREVAGHELEYFLGVIRNAYPNDVLYVREVNETVVRVIQPGEKVSNGFHFTS